MVYFTKLNMIIALKTRDKLNKVKLHNNLKCFLLPKMCVIQKKGIQYRFQEILAIIDMRWLDVKLTKNDRELGV